MASEPMFAAQPAYERRLTKRGTLRRRALALIVVGLVFVAMGGANLDLFDVTVGVISVAAGGAWRLWLAILDP
jgi:small neutral amino acid transporter SnatA (MarC family)